MAQALLPEILDRIFARLCPFGDAWHWDVPPYPELSLKNCTLVCKAWREPAQKRLLCLIELFTVKDLKRWEAWNAQGKLPTCKSLLLRLYSTTVPRKNRLHASMLLPHIAQFQNIKQLQIETHTVEDDTSLAEFITSCQALEVLTIMHARRVEYTTEWDEEDESDDEEDSEAGWDTDSDCHYTTSIAAFPSLFKTILPSLSNLRHLALHRLDLRVPEDLLDKVSNLARLVNLSITFCSLSGRSLAFLLEASRFLLNLAIVQPDCIRKEALVKTLSPRMASLESLSLVFPWYDYVYPPYLAGVGKKITGVVEDLVAKCQRLQYLRCQDSELALDSLDALKSLDTLYVTVDNVHTVDIWMKREQRLQVRKVALDIRGPPKPDEVEIQTFINAWRAEGINVRNRPPIAADQTAMDQFAAFLPDRIVT